MYLGLSILELSKILMYEFWHDYLKPKYGKKKTKLCYMDTDSKNRLYLHRFCRRCWSKIWHFILWIRVKFSIVELRGKTYSFLIDDGSENKKAKDTRKCVIKKKT